MPIPLERLTTDALVSLIHQGDEEAVRAVGDALPDLARAVDAVALRLAAGGTVLAVGAGTSGRLAALDAAELGPTYGWPAERWRAEMAGGMAAFWAAQEGAEDDEAAGSAAGGRLTRADVLLAVAASGRTPYVRGALTAAGRVGALTVGIFGQAPAALDPLTAIPIHLATGPELVRGSTRMKAGTAQKMALTLLSTAVMVKGQRVTGDVMVDMRVTNAKLRARAVGFVAELVPCPPEQAEALLTRHGWSVRRAVASAWTGLDGADLEAWTTRHPQLADGRPPSC